MTAPLPMATAAALMDAAFAEKWLDRASAGPAARRLLGQILARLLATGAPLPVETLAAPADPEAAAALRALDDRDMVLVRDGHVVLAYPLSALPTPFVVVLADGRERFACCAIDALGVAPLLGEPVGVRARCHDCGAPLALEVTPEGPVGSHDTVAWVGERRDIREKACASL